MTELKRELSIPPDVESNGGTEILRLFISNGAMSLSMQRAFAEPEAWGRLLAELASQAAELYARETPLKAAERSGRHPHGAGFRPRPDRSRARRPSTELFRAARRRVLMAIAILMPAVEPSARTARLARWLRREGDFVEAGDPVAEIATAHATMDVEAPRAGVLRRILVAAGAAEIAVASEIATLEPRPASASALRQADGGRGRSQRGACSRRRARAARRGRGGLRPRRGLRAADPTDGSSRPTSAPRSRPMRAARRSLRRAPSRPAACVR